MKYIRVEIFRQTKKSSETKQNRRGRAYAELESRSAKPRKPIIHLLLFSLRMAYATLCYPMLRRSRVNVGRHPSTGEGNLSALYALHRVPPHKSNPPSGVGSDG